MTVQNTTRKIRANGDGIVVAFQFSFPAKVTTDIVVKKIVNSTGVATTQTVGVDYTITLNTVTEGGTVTYTVAPTALEDSFIIRESEQDQQTALPIGGNFPEISVENEIDRSRLIDIELQEQINRSLLTPDTETGLNISVPLGTSAANRASKIWGWDTAGTDLTLFSTVETVSVINAEGDLVQGSTLGVAEKLAIGATNAVLQVVSGKATWVTNPTILLPTIADFTNATHDHSNAAGGGSALAGRWELIESQTAAASASIDFTSKFSANYDLYMVALRAIKPTTDTDDLELRVGNAGFDSGANDYGYVTSQLSVSGVTETDTLVGDDNISEIVLASSLGTGANEEVDGIVYLHDPFTTTSNTRTTSVLALFGSAGVPVKSEGIGVRKIDQIDDSVQFLMSTGTIASGIFDLYGLRV